MAGDINLNEDQITQLEAAIGSTAEQAQQKFGQIYESYQAVVGGAWQGGAATMAVGKQDEFSGVGQRLMGILIDLQEGVTGNRNLMTETDSESEAHLAAVDPTDGGGMGAKVSRL